MKKYLQKLLIIGPDPFFLYWPGCPNGPKTEILYHQKSLNAWVLRLRLIVLKGKNASFGLCRDLRTEAENILEWSYYMP